MLSKNYKREVSTLREQIRKELKEELRLIKIEDISDQLKKKLLEKVVEN